MRRRALFLAGSALRSEHAVGNYPDCIIRMFRGGGKEVFEKEGEGGKEREIYEELYIKSVRLMNIQRVLFS